MNKKQVLLTKLWAGHQPGEIVEEDAPCADSMVAKGYGRLYTPPRKEAKPGKSARQPRAETADAPPVAETADVTPQTKGKTKPPVRFAEESTDGDGTADGKAGD